MFKLDLEKAEEPEIKLLTSVGSLKKQENFRKNIYFCFIDYAKTFDCVDHNKLWKTLWRFLRKLKIELPYNPVIPFLGIYPDKTIIQKDIRLVQTNCGASLVAQMVKASAYNAGDPGLIPGSGRSPGEGNGTPLQYSCLENSMDRGAW